MKDAAAGVLPDPPRPGEPSGADASPFAGAPKFRPVAFLLLFVFSFVVYNWTFAYVIALERKTPYCFFMFDREFLAKCLDHPGGLLIYATCFFAQFYHYTWLGALTIAALVTCFGALFHSVLKRLMTGASIFHAFFSCILLLTVFNDCVLDLTLALMVCAGAFWVWLRLPTGPRRLIYTLIALPALYLLAGAYFWIFAIWVIASEWLGSRPSAHLGPKLLYPVWAAALPLAAWWRLFPVSPRGAALWPTVFAVDYAHSPTLVAFSAYLMLLPFWARLLPLSRDQGDGGTERPRTTTRTRTRTMRWGLILAVLAVSLAWVSYDSVSGRFAELDGLYEQRQWDAILEKAATNPPHDLMSQFFTNCALQHKGKLLEEMFHYPQPEGTRGLILNLAGSPHAPSKFTADSVRGAMYNSDLFFEMGHVNAAFLHAFVQMSVLGRTCSNLSRMAECCMVKGEYKVAETYLNALERTLFCRGYAQQRKALLANPQAADKYFAESRSWMPTVELDMFCGGFAPELSLLKTNPRNRMAFDYFAAYCLLDKVEIPLLTEETGCLKDAGYTAVPTHLQEALMGYERGTGRRVDLRGFEYDERTASRFEAFLRQRYPSKPAAARALQPEFGDTYMYYAAFGAAPMRYDRSAAHLRLGDDFRSEGMVADAIAQYRHALEFRPQFSEAHARLGDVLTSQGKPDEAALEYRLAEQSRQDSGKANEGLNQTPSSRTE